MQTDGVADHGAPDELDQPDTVTAGQVEPKVRAATVAGAGSAGVITPAVVLAVDQLFYGGGTIDVPLPYVGVIGLIVTGLCTFAGGYLARHVDRAPTA